MSFADALCFFTTGGHLLNDRKAQEQAYAVLEEAQKQVAGVTAPSVYAELRAAWVWEPS